jgi:hypothetical protein
MGYVPLEEFLRLLIEGSAVKRLRKDWDRTLRDRAAESSAAQGVV